jgi:preprotein translocase subunit SecB
MTDQPSSPANGQTRPTALPINILAQYLKDLSFENPRAPQSLVQGQPTPDISIQVDIETATQAETVYEVTLNLRVEAKSGPDIIFLAEVSYAALLSLPGLPVEHRRPVLLIEGPRLLFPFVRAIIADATRNGGYPPLLLNPIDFAELYRRRTEDTVGSA